MSGSCEMRLEFQHEQVMVELMTVEHDGKLYGLGACPVWIGGIKVEQAAVKCSDVQRITTVDRAYDWLTDHGLPEDVTQNLCEEAGRYFGDQGERP